MIVNPIIAFFECFTQDALPAVLLGGNLEPSPLNRWAIMGFLPCQNIQLIGRQLQVNQARWELDDSASLFQHLRACQQRARVWPDTGLPMVGGFAGVFGYEAYAWTEPALFADADHGGTDGWPTVLLYEFSDWCLVDLEHLTLVVFSDDSERKAAYHRQWKVCLESKVQADITDITEPADEAAIKAYLKTFQASFSESAFVQAVAGLKGKIEAGDIYQANLSLRLEKQMKLNPYAIFQTLCQRNPSPFSGLFKWDGGYLICNSPERLVCMSAAGEVATRPIAGTRGRGQSEAEDARIGERLRSNEKERAEHLMLVDLARNDLGRVCVPGTVTVPELLTLERYSHVTHLVSQVAGQLSPAQDSWGLLSALFPGGTITGCPKIRCMEILRETEPVLRNWYTGSLGYTGTAGLDWNILIRSLYLQATKTPFVYNTAIQVGAGIVADSEGVFEYRECLRKAHAMLGVLYDYEDNRREQVLV